MNERKPWLPGVLSRLGRAASALCRLVLLTATMVGGLLLAVDMARFFLGSSDFSVKEISMEGNARASGEELRARSGVAPGANIWLLDLDEIRLRLESHPAVKNASVSRVPPHRLHIRIEERAPAAFLRNPEDGRFYGIDFDGAVFIAVEEDTAPEGVRAPLDYSELLAHPVLTGFAESPPRMGRAAKGSRLAEALGFIGRLGRESPGLLAETAEIELRPDGGVWMHPRRRIGVVKLGELDAPDLEKKLAALWSVMEREGLLAEYVDARFPGQGFAVRWDEAGRGDWLRLSNEPRTQIISAAKEE